MSSIGFFETSAQADESTRAAATWVGDEKLETAPADAPKITVGQVFVQQTRVWPRCNSSTTTTGKDRTAGLYCCPGLSPTPEEFGCLCSPVSEPEPTP